MGLKADASFLRFVTMGAAGTRAVMEYMTALGFEPIELERYSTTNKIWATKVKRLRLPDILCVRTGLRVEARAKSDLAVKMSHSPNNHDRAWDAGLRPEDVVAFAKVEDNNGAFAVSTPEVFKVADLQASFATAKLGPPKSQSEGAERDVTWPTWVPGASGQVEAIAGGKVTILKQDGRKQTYPLKNKVPYAGVGDSFSGGSCVLAGTPAAKVDLSALAGATWDPYALLASNNVVDRYAAIRALAYEPAVHRARAVAAIKARLPQELDARSALECAASLARLEDQEGYSALQAAIDAPALPYLRMEALLILSELASPTALSLLTAAANRADFAGSEERQAAVWGLGAGGCRANAELLPFIDDADTDVALHAMAAFGAPLDPVVRNSLLADVFGATARRASAARAVLAEVGGSDAVHELVARSRNPTDRVTALPALGAFGKDRLLAEGVPGDVVDALNPLFALTEKGENWLAEAEVHDGLAYLRAQRL